MAYPQVNTVINGNTVEVVSTQRLVPTVETTIKTDAPTISTIVQNYWDGIWSINGQTGDVTLTFTLETFQPNTTYAQNSAVIYNGSIWIANRTFTAGDTFDEDDWTNVAGHNSADQISYSNATTTIPANNVQEAIDYAFVNGAGIEYIITDELPTQYIHEKALYLIPKNPNISD